MFNPNDPDFNECQRNILKNVNKAKWHSIPRLIIVLLTIGSIIYAYDKTLLSSQIVNLIFGGIILNQLTCLLAAFILSG